MSDTSDYSTSSDSSDAGADARSSRHSHSSSNPGSQRDHAQARTEEAAADVKDAAWQQAESQFERQSGFAAEQAAKLSAALRNMADEFEHQNQHAFSGYANNLAQYSDSLSHNLREKDLNYLIRETQNLSRRQPALFVGGAVAAGFLLARFMRSSATPSQSSSTSSRSPQPRTAVGYESNTPSSSTSADDRIRQD